MLVGSLRMPLALPVKCGPISGLLLMPLLLLGRSSASKLTRDKTAYYRCILFKGKNVRFNIFLEASGSHAHWKLAPSLITIDTEYMPVELLDEYGLDEPGSEVTLEEYYTWFSVTMRQLSQLFAAWYVTCPWLRTLCDLQLFRGKIPAGWPAATLNRDVI